MIKIPELKKTVQGILLENESMSKHCLLYTSDAADE